MGLAGYASHKVLTGSGKLTSEVNFLDPVRAIWRTHVVQESCEMHFQCKPFATLPIISGVQKTKKENMQRAGSLPLGWKFAAESEVCRCSKFAAGVKLLISYLQIVITWL